MTQALEALLALEEAAECDNPPHRASTCTACVPIQQVEPGSSVFPRNNVFQNFVISFQNSDFALEES